ncbi:hypothetical protein GGX14DRAFT_405845 [Mycena pura]|uniref:Uncharacterized protein n=1 Tax=Mycena pura TaxID=153505 RepID=A0AAD6URR2_9AGAR|nr:hypothetical protein GGX14DRAFT_405845 [Mycena pura]
MPVSFKFARRQNFDLTGPYGTILVLDVERGRRVQSASMAAIECTACAAETLSRPKGAHGRSGQTREGDGRMNAYAEETETDRHDSQLSLDDRGACTCKGRVERALPRSRPQAQSKRLEVRQISQVRSSRADCVLVDKNVSLFLSSSPLSSASPVPGTPPATKTTRGRPRRRAHRACRQRSGWRARQVIHQPQPQPLKPPAPAQPLASSHNPRTLVVALFMVYSLPCWPTPPSSLDGITSSALASKLPRPPRPPRIRMHKLPSHVLARGRAARAARRRVRGQAIQVRHTRTSTAPSAHRDSLASLSVLTSPFGAARRGDHVRLADLPGVEKDQFPTSREYFPSRHISDAFREPYMESKEYAHPWYGYAGYPGSSDSTASSSSGSGSASPWHRFRKRGASVSADSDSDHADTHRRPGSRYTVDAHASSNTSYHATLTVLQLDSMSTAAGRGLGFPRTALPSYFDGCEAMCAQPPAQKQGTAWAHPSAGLSTPGAFPVRFASQGSHSHHVPAAPYNPYAPYAAARTYARAPALGDPSHRPLAAGLEARGREEAGHGVPLLPRAQDRVRAPAGGRARPDLQPVPAGGGYGVGLGLRARALGLRVPKILYIYSQVTFNFNPFRNCTQLFTNVLRLSQCIPLIARYNAQTITRELVPYRKFVQLLDHLRIGEMV